MTRFLIPILVIACGFMSLWLSDKNYKKAWLAEVLSWTGDGLIIVGAILMVVLERY